MTSKGSPTNLPQSPKLHDKPAVFATNDEPSGDSKVSANLSWIAATLHFSVALREGAKTIVTIQEIVGLMT